MMKPFGNEVVKNPIALSRRANSYAFETFEDIFNKCGNQFFEIRLMTILALIIHITNLILDDYLI